MFLAQAGVEANHYISFMSMITNVLIWVRTQRTGQRYNVPVLRYRTPFEYACGSTNAIDNVRVGPGQRPRFNQCLSFTMTRSAIITRDYISPHVCPGFTNRYAR
jgi:hypothetical protein